MRRDPIAKTYVYTDELDVAAANAKFIALSRDLVPRLLAALEEAERRIATQLAYIEQLIGEKEELLDELGEDAP